MKRKESNFYLLITVGIALSVGAFGIQQFNRVTKIKLKI